jgi:hypothetical protein
VARRLREGQSEGVLLYLSFGEGPLLVVFPGLGTTNANPSGIQRWGEMRTQLRLEHLHQAGSIRSLPGNRPHPRGRAGNERRFFDKLTTAF